MPRLDGKQYLWLATAALIVAIVPQRAAHAQLFHPNANPRRSFEVATIKPNDNPQPGLFFALSVTNFRATHATLKDLVKLAYNVGSEGQLTSLSGWMTSEHFDIQAKASEADIEATNKLGFNDRLDEVRLMVQSLLAQRFALKVTFKTARLPVYALVVAKGGPKMKEVELSPMPPPGTRPPPGAHLPGLRLSGPNQFTAAAWSMNKMANWLMYFDEIGDRVVVDETGLMGYYDFALSGVSQHSQANADPNATTAEVPVTSIFAALPEQLGLKLEPRKAPVAVMVIDHVEQPSPN